VSCFYHYAMFCPSLIGFENGAMTCRIIKLNRTAISITIKNGKTACIAASIWVYRFYGWAMFHPSLNGATTCRIIKLKRMALSITIENMNHYTLQPAYECHAFIIMQCFAQV
jgi:hypothetical protein